MRFGKPILDNRLFDKVRVCSFTAIWFKFTLLFHRLVPSSPNNAWVSVFFTNSGVLSQIHTFRPFCDTYSCIRCMGSIYQSSLVWLIPKSSYLDIYFIFICFTRLFHKPWVQEFNVGEGFVLP